MRPPTLEPSTWRWALLTALLGFVGLIALSGCPGHLDDPESFRRALCGQAGQPVCTTTTSTNTTPPTTAEIQSTILVPKCGSGGCHAAMFPGGGLDLVSPNLQQRLVSVTSSTALCSGRVLVNPGAPDASLMWTKLSEPPACGTKMPEIGMLTADELAKIKAWIEGLQ